MNNKNKAFNESSFGLFLTDMVLYCFELLEEEREEGK